MLNLFSFSGMSEHNDNPTSVDGPHQAPEEVQSDSEVIGYFKINQSGNRLRLEKHFLPISVLICFTYDRKML